MNSISLRLLPQKSKAEITRIIAKGELAKRIRDIGLNPGTELEVIGKAPLKDPVAVRVRNFTLALRNNEADHIFVLPVQPN